VVTRKGLFYLVVGLMLVSTGGYFAWDWLRSRPLADAHRAFQERQFELAARLAELRLAQGRADDPEAILLAARAYANQGKWPEAEAYFAQIRVTDVEDLQLRARGLEVRQLWSEAAWIYEQILHERPNDANTLQHLAAIRSQQGRDEEALILARRLIQIPSHQVTGYVISGLVEFRLRNPTRAVELLEKAVALSPDLEAVKNDRGKVLEWLAEGLLELGRAEDAERFATKARELSTEASACYILGQARQQIGDETGAMSYWKEALARDPKHIASLVEISRVYLRRLDPDEAKIWATRARDLEPNDSTVQYLLTTIDRMLDQKRSAPDPTANRTP
jgi:tetratricopeptide (TPR) repeat protein